MDTIFIEPHKKYSIKFSCDTPPIAHIFDDDDVNAIQAAHAARRPLLVRGEPGVGKTQLALAVAVATGRAFVQKVVNIRTEPQDLLWIDDPIARLADAQLISTASPLAGDVSAMHAARQYNEKVAHLRDKISDRRLYFTPGVFWWAFDWSSAQKQASCSVKAIPAQPEGCHPSNGVVVLIDEIDKAETDLPNGLLEVLGARRFTPDFFDEQPIEAKRWPLVIITTNEERELPAAFMRRCVVLNVALPDSADNLEDFLITRGKAHLEDSLHEDAIKRAAKLLRKARENSEERHERLRPGQAEFIDLLNAVAKLEFSGSRESQLGRMDQIAQFFLKKSKLHAS